VKKKTRVPSFSKIIATDYPAFLASLIPIFLFFLYLVFLIVQRSLTRPLLPQATLSHIPDHQRYGVLYPLMA
jgi:hypothetical protein